MLPQPAFVVIEPGIELVRIIYRRGVHVDLIPWHEEWSLVALPLCGAQPFAVEEVAHSVGGAFEHHAGHRLHGYTGRHRAYQVERIVLEGVAPECHLAQMGHRAVHAARRLLVLAGTHCDTASSPGDIARVAHALERTELRLALLRPVFGRIVRQYMAVHAAYGA